MEGVLLKRTVLCVNNFVGLDLGPLVQFSNMPRARIGSIFLYTAELGEDPQITEQRTQRPCLKVWKDPKGLFSFP